VDLERAYGFSVEGLTPVNRHQFGISADWQGVVVTSVVPRAAAQEAGLRVGFVITAVGTRDIEGLQDFYQEMKKAGGKKPILILVRSPRSNAQATLAIPPR
jgi:S1-C subfamily serine protease